MNNFYIAIMSTSLEPFMPPNFKKAPAKRNYRIVRKQVLMTIKYNLTMFTSRRPNPTNFTTEISKTWSDMIGYYLLKSYSPCKCEAAVNRFPGIERSIARSICSPARILFMKFSEKVLHPEFITISALLASLILHHGLRKVSVPHQGPDFAFDMT